MKRIQILRTSPLLLILSLCFTMATADTQAAAKSMQWDIILVEASNSGDGIDPSLKQYAGTLKRLFRFNSYQKVGSKTASVTTPGTNKVQLANGQTLSIKTQRSQSGISADLNWSAGIRARLSLRPGKPAVLGGPRTSKGGATYLLIVKMR